MASVITNEELQLNIKANPVWQMPRKRWMLERKDRSMAKRVSVISYGNSSSTSRPTRFGKCLETKGNRREKTQAWPTDVGDNNV